MNATFESIMVSVNADDRKAQRESLGTHICKNPSDEYLFEKSNEMLGLIAKWAENWKIIQAEVEPKIADIRKRKVAEKAKELTKFSKEELQEMMRLLEENAVGDNAPEAEQVKKAG